MLGHWRASHLALGRQVNEITTAEKEALAAKGAFTVSVLPSSVYFETRANQAVSLPWHDTVLRPLLAVAAQAWVYEMQEGSDTFKSAETILMRKAGKYEIQLGGEPIKGHELFWNASGGQRGSIALLFAPTEIPTTAVFPHCERAFLINNPSVPHSPAAIRYVKSATSDGRLVAGMLSRTNGLQWLSFHGAFEPLARLFVQAKALVKGANAP